MCVGIAKWFPQTGWVGVKNRDRNYVPDISFRREHSDDKEILMFWDDVTKYCEGMNSDGVSIISTSLMVSDDEKEIDKRSSKPSPDGSKIRRALKCSDVKSAVKSLIADKLPGHTIIFDRDNCYILEGCWKPHGGYSRRDYAYKIKKLDNNECWARTNHGVLLPWAGYQRNTSDKNQSLSRISSESRMNIAQHVAESSTTPIQIVNDLVKIYSDEPQLNALRTTHGGKKMRTTSQILMIPSELTMHVRPIQSNMNFNFWEHNQPKHQLFVEILSNKPLYDNLRTSGTESSFGNLFHKSS